MIKNNASKALVILIIFSVISSIAIQLIQINRDKIKQADEIKYIYNLEDGYIYFGRPSCPACKRFKPILKLISQERNLKINYFNSDYFRKEKNAPEDSLMMVFEKYNIDSIPHLVYIENGEISKVLTSDTVGDKDKSMVYHSVNMMIDKIKKNQGIGFNCLPCLLIVLGVVIFQFISNRYNKLTKNINYILIAPLLTSIGILICRYIQFRNIGLNFAKDNRASFVISLATIILVAASILINRNKIKNS